MPVRSKMPPTLISSAPARPAKRSAAAAHAAHDRFPVHVVMSSSVVCASCPPAALAAEAGGETPSVRERVQLPVRLDLVPPRGHAVGLEDEEEHDGEAEEPNLERGEETLQRRELLRERAGEEAQDLGEQGDEDRPEDAPQHGSHPADDDHAELIDGERDGEVLRADDARLV